MGYRKLTNTEFQYIKELLKKNKKDVKKVAELSQRSEWTVSKIKGCDTFEDYSSDKKEVKQVQKPLFESKEREEAKPQPAKPANQSPIVKNYSGAMLAEMRRMREVNQSLNDFLGIILDELARAQVRGVVAERETYRTLFILVSVILAIVVFYFSK